MAAISGEGNFKEKPPIYGDDEMVYTLELHYNGQIIYNGDGGLFYATGEIRCWDWIDPNAFFLSDIDGFLEETEFFKTVGFGKMEDFRKSKGYAYYWKVHGKELEDGYRELGSNFEILDMGLDVMVKKKYAHVYLINKEELKLALEDAAIVEMVLASQMQTPRAEALDDENNIDIDVEVPIARHSESEASSGLHDSENEPSGDEKDATEFDVQVEREPFRIDTDVGVDVESVCGASEELKSIYSSDEEGDIERHKFPLFNAKRDVEDPHFKKGQEFTDFSTFKRAVMNYSIKSKRQIRF
ncbi:hypothetical protein LINPERHAP2_LOCUS142 [Linum perenne]